MDMILYGYILVKTNKNEIIDGILCVYGVNNIPLK